MNFIKIAIVALIALSSACAAGLSSAERQELATLRQRQNEIEAKDRAERVARAERDGYRPPGSPELPTNSPTPPAAGGGIGTNGFAQSGNVAVGAMVARGQQQVYVGAVGSMPRQVTGGRKLKLVNHVCDGGSRDGGLNCADEDGNGYQDYNSFLAFEIEGKPVVCDSRMLHPVTREALLPPTQTCFVETGRSRKVSLTVKKYRNFGTIRQIMLDPQPDATYTAKIDFGSNGVTLHSISEVNFP